MKGADAHPLDGPAAAEMMDEPLTHLVRRLVCEGDGGNFTGLDLLFPDQPGDAGDERLRLARARPGDDHNGLFHSGDSVLLCLIQPIEQVPLLRLFLNRPLFGGAFCPRLGGFRLWLRRIFFA